MLRSPKRTLSPSMSVDGRPGDERLGHPLAGPPPTRWSTRGPSPRARRRAPPGTARGSWTATCRTSGAAPGAAPARRCAARDAGRRAPGPRRRTSRRCRSVTRQRGRRSGAGGSAGSVRRGGGWASGPACWGGGWTAAVAASCGSAGGWRRRRGRLRAGGCRARRRLGAGAGCRRPARAGSASAASRSGSRSDAAGSPRPPASTGMRTDVDDDRAGSRRSCQPRRQPPGSITAVQASVATPEAERRQRGDPQGSRCAAAPRPTPIGRPSRGAPPAGRPAALPGETPATPSSDRERRVRPEHHGGDQDDRRPGAARRRRTGGRRGSRRRRTGSRRSAGRRQRVEPAVELGGRVGRRSRW